MDIFTIFNYAGLKTSMNASNPFHFTNGDFKGNSTNNTKNPLLNNAKSMQPKEKSSLVQVTEWLILQYFLALAKIELCFIQCHVK